MMPDTPYQTVTDVWYTIAVEMSRQRNRNGDLYSADHVIAYANAVADAYREYVSKLT